MNIEPIAKINMPIEKMGLSERLREKFGSGFFIFGPKEWGDYFGEIGESIPLPENIEKILSSPCPIHGDKAIWQTHGLIYFPREVNKEPFTLNLLGKLAKHPKKGDRSIGYKEKKERELIFDIAGDQPIQASYWALITKDILPESRGLFFDGHTRFVADLAERSRGNYQQTDVLSLSTLILMKYLISGKCLFSNDPWTYARCRTIGGAGPFVVGGFSPQGLIIYDDTFPSDLYGVAAMKKFV